MSEHVVIVGADGAAVLTPVAEYLSAKAKREAEEAARIAAAKARGAVPEDCGPEVPEAPARGAFKVVRPQQLYPVGNDGWAFKDAGYQGRSVMRYLDAFDVMTAQSVKRQKPLPFTADQMAVGRYYRELLERQAHAGVRCSSVEALRGGGSGNGGDFMDALLRDRQKIEVLNRRIGSGYALEVRRLRPTERNWRSMISDRTLVELVCVQDLTLSEILVLKGWVKPGKKAQGKHIKALRSALAAALNRMLGPLKPHQKQVMHRGTVSGFPRFEATGAEAIETGEKQ